MINGPIDGITRWCFNCAALLIASLCAAGFACPAQAQWVPQNSGTGASFRGMSVVSDDIVWISGTRGTFAWTGDGGEHWHSGTVAGAGSFDFRAVHAMSLDTALLMVSAQDTALIYRTTDRGATWTRQYSDETKGAFLDAMTFFDSRHGLALGDPMDGRFVVLETSDGGQSWSRIAAAGLPPSLPGEGGFAASGTALISCGSRDAWFGTGGAVRSRVFHSSDGGHTWSVAETPIVAGNAAAGIFSLACDGVGHLLAAGGNYSHPDPAAITVALSDDGGVTWTASEPSPATGYLSGVAYVDPGAGSRLVAVGTEGTAASLDGGRHWSALDSLSLNVVMASRAPTRSPASSRGGSGRIWAAGSRGRVVLLSGLRIAAGGDTLFPGHAAAAGGGASLAPSITSTGPIVVGGGRPQPR